MATFTCLCGHVIREDQKTREFCHVLWNNSPGFYEKLSGQLTEFLLAKAARKDASWLQKRFGAEYPTDLPLAEVTRDIVESASADVTSDLFHCPKCRRLHIGILGSRDEWESYVPERRKSGR